MKKIVVIGAGGHARVLADLISLLPDTELAGFLDDQLEIGTIVHGTATVLGTTSDAGNFSDRRFFVSGIGNNAVRKQLAEQFGSLSWATLVHPMAFVSPSAVIGSGSVILAGAVVASNSGVGTHTIVNSGTVVDHDCRIGHFVHLKIGTKVGSNSVVNDGFSSEIGAVIPAFSNTDR